jgi:hypothetical protein
MMNKQQEHPQQSIYHRIMLAFLLGLALIARLIWLSYTNFAEEDSFIVLRFARNLANGLGYVFNPGERVYGSTTPLYTFILVLWRWLFGADFILGARLLCIGAALGSLSILWILLRRMQLPSVEQIIPLVLLGIASKSLLMDTQGLESPFVILFMMASWYMFATERPGRAGLFAGLMLWVRIDTLLWPVAMAIAACLTDIRRGIKLLVVTGLIYLPWLIIAWQYFGSPIPLTVLAKWSAAGLTAITPQEHLTYIIGYISLLDFGPFSISSEDMFPALVTGFFTLIIAAWHGFFSIRKQWLLAPTIFILIEIVRLADTRAAIDYRYYYPLLWFVWILFVLGVLSLWEKVQQRGLLSAWIPRALGAFAATLVLFFGFRAAGVVRDFQTYRNEGSLKAIGFWLNNNTPMDATILLEPLGYIGYYSDRILLDDAGLITPRAVTLRLQGVPRNLYYQHITSDFVVTHCDYPANMRALHPGAEEDFMSRFQPVARFDPLLYISETPERFRESILPWAACYVIWQRK